MKPDGIEAPVAPVLGAPRRSRDRARIAAVAVIAVAVLAVGIGLAGNGFTIAPSSTGSPGPSGSLAPSGSSAAQMSPSTPGESLLPPTTSPVLQCAPVRLGKPPEIRLTSNPGGMVIEGVAGPSVNGGTGSGAPTWPVLPLGGALRAGQSTLDLSALDHGCIRYVATEYAPSSIGNSSGGASFPVPFRTLNVSPPQSFVSLGSLPAGDWTLRVVAYFSTGQVGQEDASVIERFFRVITSPSDDPVPIPTPITAPAVACAPLPRDGGPPSLVLTGSPNGPIQGTTGISALSRVPVRIGDRIEVRVNGDTCALAWDFTTAPDSNPDYTHSDGEPNPGNDPFLFAQNRWLLHDLPTGQVAVTATVRFSADVSTTARWLLDVQAAMSRWYASPPPTARRSWPHGLRVDQPGFRSARRAASRSALAAPLPPTIPFLTAPDESLIRIEVPGWTIMNWGASCGRPDPSSPTSPFVIVGGCDVGGWYSRTARGPRRAHAGGLPQSRRDAALPDIRPGRARERGRDDDGLCRHRPGRMTGHSLTGRVPGDRARRGSG